MERKFIQFAVGLNLMLMSTSGFAYSALTAVPGANQSSTATEVREPAATGLNSDGELVANPGNIYEHIDLIAIAETESQDIHGTHPVQLPAPAAVWLFLTGFFGLLYLNRRH